MKKTIKESYKGLSKIKKILLFMGIFMISFASAYWVISYSSITTYAVFGGDGIPYEVTIELTDMDFDVSLSDTTEQTLMIEGVATPTQMILSISTEFTPHADELDCPFDLENPDVTFEFGNHLGTINDGDTFQLNGDAAAFDLVGSVDPALAGRTCKGSYAVSIGMVEA